MPKHISSVKPASLHRRSSGNVTKNKGRIGTRRAYATSGEDSLRLGRVSSGK